MRFLLIPTIVTGLSFGLTTLAKAQAPSLRGSPSYERAATGLRAGEKKAYTFTQARLSDVFRLMATDADIPFISLPSDEEDASRMVTFTMNEAPFTALEKLAKANGIALVYEDAVWYLRPANDKELIGKTYVLKHNTKEKIKYNGGEGGGGSGSGGGGGSAGGGQQLSTGISLQGGGQEVFEVEPSKLVEDIKEILGISSQAGLALLSNETYLQAVKSLGGGGSAAGGIDASPVAPILGSLPGSNQSGHDSGAKVLWNTDSNTLFVVATRSQHQWVQDYLEASDRPQPLIAVELKFFETTKDPRNQLGFDWSGTMGEGLNFDLNGGGADGGSSDSLRIGTTVDFNDLNATVAPTAVLSGPDLSMRLRAFLSDHETTQVSYPRVLTLSNREVVIRSVINEPILAASSSTTPGAGATSTSNVQYVPIGTIINVLPRQMEADNVLLNISLTLSSIIGTKEIDGNPYPIASSRVFHAPITVKSGYTVAIGGLEEALNTNGASAIPTLSKLPVLGNLFKSRDKRNTRKNLMLFITPTLIHTKTQGISQKPVSRRAGLDESRLNHTSGFDATMDEYERDLVYLEHIGKEGHGDNEDYDRAKYIRNQSANMIKVTRALRKSRSVDPAEADAKLAALQSIQNRASNAERRLLWYANRGR